MFLPPKGASAQLVGTKNNQQPTTKQKRLFVMFFRDFRGWGASCEVFSGIPGISGDGAHLVKFFLGISGDGADPVRFCSRFPTSGISITQLVNSSE